MMITTCLLLLLAACVLFEGLYTLPEARIINGNYMEIEKAPWQVSIQVYGEHTCGGSIYSAWIIISAAHCFYANDSSLPYRLRDAKEFLIVAGSEFKRSRETIAAVSAIIVHDDYSVTMKCDIAIMKLVSPLPLSKQVRPIPLAVKDPAPGSVVLATGWGAIANLKDNADNAGKRMPEVLQSLYINTIKLDSCHKFYVRKNEHICVKAAGKSVCYGDSGGPLVFEKTLVGVASFVTLPNCSDSGVYASVTYYRKWILDAIKSISKK